MSEEFHVAPERRIGQDKQNYMLRWLSHWGIPLLFTGVIGISAVRLGWPQYQNCREEWFNWPSYLDRVVASINPPSNCLTLNEIGDFLAGSFAPLAFVWLAFAVVVQSKELSAQRKELELSRDIAREARNAALAQAEEARRSADYFKTQTETMILQMKQDQQDQANSELPGLCNEIYDEARRELGSIMPADGHEYTRVKMFMRGWVELGNTIEDLPDGLSSTLVEKFERLLELWPKISESNRIHIGYDEMSIFFNIESRDLDQS